MNILDVALAGRIAASGGGGGGSGTDNYNDLSNLPKINDTTLSGNKSSSALGLQSEINSESKLASDLVDDTNQDNKFVTSTEKNTWNGKQNAIDADHKINADYVDDSTSTNKFVTASDKETWNAKQNAIDNSHKLSSDLVDDANHTNKFVTSTEKQTWNAKQNAIDSDHKLSSSLVSFTTAEAAALASGIDSSKVVQISTNQTNILYAINTGVKNQFPTNGMTPGSTVTDHGVTLTYNENGTFTLNGTATGGAATFVFADIPASQNDGNVFKNCILIGGYSSGIYVAVDEWDATVKCRSYDNTTPVDISIPANLRIAVFIRVNGNTQAQNVVVYPFICDKTVYTSDSTFAKPARQNYDLTRLEAEDRAALAEEIDAGAKNKVNIADVTITASSFVLDHVAISLSAGSYTFSYTSNQSISGDIQLILRNGTTILADHTVTSKSGRIEIPFTLASAADNITLYSVRAGTYSDFMICTKAAFGVSSKFVPYRLNYDLVCQNIKDVNTVLEAVL